MTLTIASSTSHQPLPRTWIEKLFDKMLLSYGKKFTDQWIGADPDKLIAHWADELSGYSREELSRGYAGLESRDWPPTLPEFKRMCRPPVDLIAAYYEAANGVQARERGEVGEWSHPAVYWASVKVGAFDLKSQSYSQIKARWEHALQDELAKGQWTPVPEPSLALPAPGKTEMSREHATKMVQELQAADTIKKAADKTDHKLWAKKILDRAKLQNHGLSGLQIRMAREALAASAE